MPLARTWDKNLGKITSSVRDGYLDRLSRWSDIQEYLPYLHDAVLAYPEAKIVELGARRGNSTLAFLAAAQQVKGHVWSVDIDNVALVADGMYPWRKIPWWTFVHGSDMDEKIQAQLPEKIDVLFIDSSHEYGHTMDELHTYMPRVAEGGVALFHDTRLKGWPGYIAPTELPPVRQALNDYCAQTGLSWEEIPGNYGLGVMRP